MLAFLIIANPTSGRDRGERTADAVAELLRHRGAKVEIRRTTSTLGAEAITAEACSGEADVPTHIVACGGDGTIHQVVNGLARARERLSDLTPILGLAPAGRCNDLAAALRLTTQPKAIANVLLDGTCRPLDLGRANDRYFCTVATLGFDAAVSSYVDAMPKWITGRPAYIYGTLQVLRRYRACRVTIESDGQTIDQSVFLASSANTSVYGGGIPIAPSADPFDGRLDLCVVDPLSKLQSLYLLLTVLRGTHVRLKEVTFRQARRIRVTSPDPLQIWADGERLTQTPATIEVIPSALRVMIPNA